MDVKELIKWLFQIKKPEISYKSSKMNSRNSLSLSFTILLPMLVIINTVNICYCDNSVNVLNNKIENENNLTLFYNNNNGDNESENKNTTKSKIKSFHFDENTREEFKAASGIIKRIRDFDKFLDAKSEEYLGKSTARTFGRPIKKLQAMMIPLMFKLGVLSTIIILTFLLALKAVAIGKILMLLSSASLAASVSKLFLLKGGHHGHEDSNKQVHLHIHNSGHSPNTAWSSPYGIPVSSITHTGHDAWNRRTEPYISDNQNFFHQTSMGASVINTPYGRYVRTGGPTAAGYK